MALEASRSPDHPVFRRDGFDGPSLVATSEEERFDRIVRLAAIALRVPSATIFVQAPDRIWFKATTGERVQLPAVTKLCEAAFQAPGPTLIREIADDFEGTPGGSSGPGARIRFFASYPLYAPDGHRLGGFCVMAGEPREFDQDMMQTLADLARLVETELHIGSMTRVQSELANNLDAARRQLLRDDLTQTWNRAGILEILSREYARARRHKHRLGVALVDLDHFKQINDQHGHLIGDRVLRTAAERMVEAVRPYDAVGRYGGEEFLIVIVENEPSVIANIAERIRRNIAGAPVSTARKTLPITASVGVAYVEPQQAIDLGQLVQVADDALYSAKRAGRNRVAISHIAAALS